MRLVRVRRLVELGLSLPDVAAALGTGPDAAGEGPGTAAGGPGAAGTGSIGPAEHGLRQVLVELDGDLARQEAALRGRRERLAELLAREADLTASDRVADLLRDVASAVPGVDAAALAREREVLEMIEATSGAEQFAEVAEQYRTALADPDQLARMTALASRFEALAGADPADPEVEALATELAEVGLAQPEPAQQDDGWRPAWRAFRDAATRAAPLPGARLGAEVAVRGLTRAAALLPAPVAIVVRHEVALLSCLVLLAGRRRDGVRPGTVPLGYAAALRPVSLLLLSVGVLELVAVELVVPWRAARVVLLVAGLYTLLALLGMTAAAVVRPHLVGAGRLRLRAGTWTDVRVPLDRVAAVRARVRTAPGRPSVVEQELVIGVLGATDVELRLTGPTPVRLGHGSVEVRGLRFAADDPAAAVRALTGASAPQRAGPVG